MMVSSSVSSKIDETGRFLRVCQRVVAHWRAIVLLLIFVLTTFLVARFSEFARVVLLGLALLLLIIASQLFWVARILDLGEWFIPGKRRRRLTIVAAMVYSFVFLYSYSEWGVGHIIRAAQYGPQNMVIYSVFWWWLVGSLLAFPLVIAFGAADRAARAAAWAWGKAREAMEDHNAGLRQGSIALEPPSRARRQFLEQTAVLLSASGFAAAGYGLLYGRQDVEVVRERIRLARLPKAFEGFHIAQLSDIHIGPFTTADYLRRCVAITNGLRPDLIALTGDYVCWDPEAQGEVVGVLAGLRAPHGVFGCLGNHEADVGIEESITRLFAAQGVRILRQECAPIQLRGDMFNLIGIDDAGEFDSDRSCTSCVGELQQLKALVVPNTINILLQHYPAFFNYPGLGIDLTLAGDIHGGQLSLDFVHRGLNLASLIGVPYIRGLYEKNGAQLYMNRGIGITGLPIRIGARPEITVLELSRI